MTSSNVSYKLNTSMTGGKIADLIYNSDLLLAAIDAITQEKRAAGAADITPTMAQINVTHLNQFASSFKPAMFCAQEWTQHCIECASGWGSKLEVRPRWSSDYMGSAYLTLETPEMRCTLADLPNIVVMPSDPDVLAHNNNRATDFGTGQLAAVTATPIVLHGFSYRYEADGTTLSANQQVTYGGKIYHMRNSVTAAEPRNGEGSIKYNYVDRYGNFIAGPNGTDAAPTVDGFGGQEGNVVQRANYVVAAECPGIKAIRRAKMIADNQELYEYTHDYATVYRRYCHSKYGLRQAYDSMIGQEVPREFATQVLSVEANRTPAGGLRTEGGLVTNYGDGGLASHRNYREYKKVSSGPQTPEEVKAPFTMHIPSLFEPNLVTCRALAWANFPDTDLLLQYELVPLDQLFYPAAGSTFIRELVRLHNEDNDDEGTYSSPTLLLERHIPFLIPGSVVSTPQMCRVEASYTIQNWYLTEIVHLCLITKILFYVTRTIITRECSISGDCCELSDATGSRFPIEYSWLLDYSLKSRDEKGNPDMAYQWNKLGHQGQVPVHEYHRHVRNIADSAAATPDYQDERIMTKYAMAPVEHPIITHLEVSLYNVTYWEEKARQFYSEIYPHHEFGRGKFRVDKETDGLLPLFISYTPLPGSFDIYGVVSPTSNRKIEYKLKINPDSPFVGIRDGLHVTGTQESLCCKYKKSLTVTISVSINCILISDGTPTLRYA